MALFQKRHYEWLARFAGETLDDAQRGLLADALEQDNPRFNRGRFIAASDRICHEYGEAVRARIRASSAS